MSSKLQSAYSNQALHFKMTFISFIAADMKEDITPSFLSEWSFYRLNLYDNGSYLTI